MDIAKLIARSQAIITSPKTEWPVIAGETTTVADLYKSTVLPLAAIPAVISFIKMSLIGVSVPFMGTYRIGVASGLGAAVVQYLLSLVMVYLVALVVDALAPSFGGRKDPVQALKVVVFSFLVGWLASIGQIVPFLGALIALAGGIYGIYLLYLGLPALMQNPAEKSGGYTAAVVVIAIILGVLTSVAVGSMSRLGGGLPRFDSSDVHFDKASPMGKLEEMGKGMEAASQQLEAAQKSGDAKAQQDALGQMMGAALGGGAGGVQSLPSDQIKAFLPETLGGMARKSFSAERNEAMGVQISEAKASYGDDNGKELRLEITDAGSAKGLLGFAAWANVEGEKQTENGFEKTYRSDGRLTHEEWNGRTGQFSVVIADRFTVEIKGSAEADNLAQLKAAAAELKLADLEALKNAGAKPAP